MYCDIVFPDGNEAEFIEMAKKLGYGAIVFAYEGEVKKPVGDIRVLTASIANEKTQGRQKGDIFMMRTGERALVERLKPDIIFDLEELPKKDHLHQRRSGLNHITADICSKKQISIGFSLSSLMDQRSRARTIGRMKQNFMLCRKYKVQMTIASFAKDPFGMRAPLDLMSLFTTIGMHPAEARKGLMLNETN